MKLIVLIAFLFQSISARLAGECATLCNDLRFEVLTLEMCREAKRTLPRPKVGDFCSNAMEQGFSDACVALCMDVRPVPRVAQTCRAAAIEMPRPTVRRWCEHGYNVAFQKTSRDLASHFNVPEEVSVPEDIVSDAIEAKKIEEQTQQHATIVGTVSVHKEQHEESSLRGVPTANARVVTARIPITMDDETKDLLVHEGENAEEAVVAFCRDNLPDDVSSCIRQLLSTVIEKLQNK